MVDRSVNPFGSDARNPNVWVDALPEEGVTETAVGGRFPTGATTPSENVRLTIFAVAVSTAV